MSTEIVTREQALQLPDEATFREQMNAINRFQQVVRATMIDGHDYGIIPGTQKPTLLKPGAEKIAKLLGLADEYEIMDQQEDWGKPFFRYMVKCRLINIRHGVTVSEGLGECNSMESRYRWRWVWPDEVPASVDKATLAKRTGKSKKTGNPWTQYRIENEDIFSQVNTLIKMAKKRSLVDASLSAGRLSDIFTQDLEDMHNIREDEGNTKQRPPKATSEPVVQAVANNDDIAEGETVEESQPESEQEFVYPQNMGEFRAWAKENYGLATAGKICAELNIADLSQVTDIKQAVDQIRGVLQPIK